MYIYICTEFYAVHTNVKTYTDIQTLTSTCPFIALNIPESDARNFDNMTQPTHFPRNPEAFNPIYPTLQRQKQNPLNPKPSCTLQRQKQNPSRRTLRCMSLGA